MLALMMVDLNGGCSDAPAVDDDYLPMALVAVFL
jgi:hypothetical protein